MRWMEFFYAADCRIFQLINRHFDRKYLNLFFRTITNLGGVYFSIATALILIAFSTNEMKVTAFSSTLALSISHIPVQLCKLAFPRKRPYLLISNTRFPENPLTDHSFPSGHTTAIFSIVLPFIIFAPFLSFVLIPLAIGVGISRIYLGLHYPSDVLAGAVLGSCMGLSCFSWLA
ncbi:phosphatase PAP2 family protein [Neobacillus sp. LXY-1]|uniref:phosphatase PAP2 family protein n=1 Tax=Neobacillus sp. LXY-1 TaxID=3379133 RepID=UPI003EE175F3